jgi:hypothetical protein
VVAESLLRPGWGVSDTQRASWGDLNRRFERPPWDFLARRADNHAPNIISIRDGAFGAITDVMGGIHGIGTGLISRHLANSIGMVTEGNHPGGMPRSAWSDRGGAARQQTEGHSEGKSEGKAEAGNTATVLYIGYGRTEA